MARRRIVAGNWKMYKTTQEAIAYVRSFLPAIQRRSCEVYLAVPFTAIQMTAQAVAKAGGSLPVRVGAQNMNDSSHGAFTGEIAGQMLTDIGAQFVLLGHSERRHIFHENDAFINRKIKRALADGLQPILCVGETLKEREAGQTENRLAQQLRDSLADISATEVATLVLAYEPVWAIGTGRSASSEMAQETHQLLRQLLQQLYGSEVAEQTPILYGGSVKAENAGELMGQADIDGLLVGGASLEATTFAQIVMAEPIAAPMPEAVEPPLIEAAGIEALETTLESDLRTTQEPSVAEDILAEDEKN